MPFFLYASFPNSRNKNRLPTVTADTYVVTLNDNTQALPTLISANDLNRTYLTLENLSTSDDMVYGYAATLALNPSVVATFGLTNDLIVSTTTNLLYVKTDDGVSTNWVVTTLPTVGFLVRFAQIAANLESLQDIYGQSNAAATVDVNVDQGRG